MDQIRLKVARLIKAQAYGDSIGLATEFMSRETVIQTYGDKFITHDMIKQDNHRNAWQKGDWTDDTDLFILCLRELVETFSVRKTNIISETSLAKKFKNWYDHGFPELGDQTSAGIGNAIRNVVNWEGYVDNPIECAKQFWILGSCSSSANGSLMRNSIFGCLTSVEDVIRNSIINSKITHYSPHCVISCIFISVLIHNLIYCKELSINEAIDDSFEIAKKSVLMEPFDPINLESVPDYEVEDPPNIENIKQDSVSLLESSIHKQNIDIASEIFNNGRIGNVFVPIVCVIYALQKTKLDTFENIIQEIIKQGGDADTNACIVASVISTQYEDLSIKNVLFEDFLNSEICSFIDCLN